MRDNIQGITMLVGRRLGKTLTIKCKVWDLAMVTIDTQDKIRRQKMIDFMPSLLVLSFQFKISSFLISCELQVN